MRNVASVKIKQTILRGDYYLEFKLNTGTTSSGSWVYFCDNQTNIQRLYCKNEEEAKKELKNIILLSK